jgi:hypothetical protein
VPTPFYHLVVAEAVLAHPALDASLRDALRAQRGAFLFGNTAPDVQTVSGQTREATHFFSFPPDPRQSAGATLLATHRELARPEALEASHAAFVAGYLAHLRLDELWIHEVFAPYFGREARWGADFRERLLLHNVVRTHLDLLDVPHLQGWAGAQVRGARPRQWLPFTADEHLLTWRDLLADQLEPGAPVHTVEIFAERMRVPPDVIHALLGPEALAERVWRHMPEERLRDFRERGIAETVALVERYYNG